MKKQFTKPVIKKFALAQSILTTYSGGDFGGDPSDRAKRDTQKPISNEYDY